MKKSLALSLSDVVFGMLINVNLIKVYIYEQDKFRMKKVLYLGARCQTISLSEMTQMDEFSDFG